MSWNKFGALSVAAVGLLSLLLTSCGDDGAAGESGGGRKSNAEVVKQVPDSALNQAGRFTICTDAPLPPFEFYDEKGDLVGFEIDFANDLAARMGLPQPQWVNSVFDTIIAALQSGKCDAIVNDMFITEERQQEIRQIPYLTSGQSFMVAEGNPEGIDPEEPSTICGKTLTTQLGGSPVEDAKKIDSDCEAAGDDGVTILQPSKFSDSLQQLQTGQAAVLLIDSPINGYYENLQPDQFEIVGPIYEDTTLLGIGVVKDNKAMIDGFIAALEAMQADGTYAELLADWGLEDLKVPDPHSTEAGSSH